MMLKTLVLRKMRREKVLRKRGARLMLRRKLQPKKVETRRREKPRLIPLKVQKRRKRVQPSNGRAKC